MSEAMQQTQGEHNPEDAPKRPKPPLPVIDPVNDVKLLDPEVEMLHVRNVRAHIVNYLGSLGVPNDIKELGALTGLLKDMDSAALGKMRIKMEDKQADISEQNRLATLAVLSHLTEVRAAGQDLVPKTAVPTGAPVLPDDVTTRDFVKGEAEQGTVIATFEQFQAAIGSNIELAKTDSDD